MYFMDVDGQRLQLTVEQLQNQTLWQRSCMDQLSMMPPLMKANDWQQMVNGLMSKSVKMDVPEELTISGQFKELLTNYCTSRIRAVSPEELSMGKPWTEDGLTKFTMSGITQFLKNRGFTEYNRAEIQEQIKNMNSGDDCYGHQNIRKDDGKFSTIRVWWVPAFENETALQNVEIENDIPF
jgi:hypothetical protein